MTRRVLRAIAGCVAACTSFAAPATARTSVAVVVIDGRGFGHGVGMPQDGALAMGLAGGRTEQILAAFYPGTRTARGSGGVRVAVHDAGRAPASTELAFPSGGQVSDAQGGQQSAGFPVEVPPGGQVRLSWDGSRYTVERQFETTIRPRLIAARVPTPGAASQVPIEPSTTLVPPPTSTTSTSSTTSTTTKPSDASTTSTSERDAPDDDDDERAPARRPAGPSSARSLWAIPDAGGMVESVARQRRYRGAVEATAALGTFRLVNQLDVELYLRGMGEVRDPAWPPAALRAQAVAARTYALRAMQAGGEICDTQRCQVYLGATAEYAAMDKAVADTAGQVLSFGSALASAVYSANGGGHTASREEGFGTLDNDVPYLRPSPYPTADPLPWSVTFDLRDVAARVGYAGTITDLRVARSGPSGRALEVAIDGTAGQKLVTGIAFDASLGLRSTLFSLRITETDSAPPPPPPATEAPIQTPPELASTPAPDAPIPPTRKSGPKGPLSHNSQQPTSSTLPIAIALGLTAIASAITTKAVLVLRRSN